MFIAGLCDADVVGTCERRDDSDAPVWSRVHLTSMEALGGGTLAYDPDTDSIAPHIHLSVGLKAHSATGHTSHLLAAIVQFLTELVIVEVTAPALRRVRHCRVRHPEQRPELTHGQVPTPVHGHQQHPIQQVQSSRTARTPVDDGGTTTSGHRTHQPVKLCWAKPGERVNQLRTRGREHLHPSMINHGPNRTVIGLRDNP
jgi:hypothetical protein